MSLLRLPARQLKQPILMREKESNIQSGAGSSARLCISVYKRKAKVLEQHQLRFSSSPRKV
jgi:hypothetical protein